MFVKTIKGKSIVCRPDDAIDGKYVKWGFA
jgi:hypothetical protein